MIKAWISLAQAPDKQEPSTCARANPPRRGCAGTAGLHLPAAAEAKASQAKAEQGERGRLRNGVRRNITVDRQGVAHRRVVVMEIDGICADVPITAMARDPRSVAARPQVQVEETIQAATTVVVLRDVRAVIQDVGAAEHAKIGICVAGKQERRGTGRGHVEIEQCVCSGR